MSRRTPSTAVPAPERAPEGVWRIALFGPVRAIHPTYGAMAFRTQRAKSMLALLVDANGEPLSRLHIAEQLWRESGSGLVNLASELFYLRKRFERPGQPFFVAEDRTLRIPPDRYISDVAQFEAVLAAAAAASAAADSDRRVAALEQAVALYAAPFTQDVYDDWTDARRFALADACLSALVRLAEAHLAAGRPDEAIVHARRALALDAYSSRAAIALLRAYGAAGAHGRARIAAGEIEAAFMAAHLRLPPDLQPVIVAIRSGWLVDAEPGPGVLPEPGPMPSPSPVPPQASATSSAPPPLPAGTLTFLMAAEAPDDRRLARSPVRGEVSLPKSEQAKRNAAPDDPVEAERERSDARQLAWQLFERRVREAAGWIVEQRPDGAGAGAGAGAESSVRRIAVFAGALDAVEAAAATLEALASRPPDKRDTVTTPQLRMALLTIEASPTVESTSTPSRAHRLDERVSDADAFPYDAAIADHLARLLGPAWGWQVLCSNATTTMALPEQHLPFNAHRRLVRLGLVTLRGDDAPQTLHMLHYGGSEGYRFPLPDGLITASGAAALTTSTSFVGRTADLEVLDAWIADPATRLVTLKGLGGIGKTRLALEVAAAQRDRMAVWSVSLVDLRDGALIAGEVVKALGETVPAGATADEITVATLARRPSLLVLDNLEHLLDPAVAFIDALLAGDRLPSLRILATSRDVLKHSAERVFDVLPLPVPDARPRPLPVLPPPADAPPDDPLRWNESVRLFTDRATAKRAAFALTDDVAPDVARLVTLLEGIPLAIELAAAKIAVLSPAQMADQIARHVRGGRYGLLKGAARDVAERHQSLQAAMDWSWALLTSEQQRFLASLSVFRGGMTLEAAEYVTEDAEALDHLLALVDASLLQRVDVEGEREPRFGMLETVREFLDSLRGEDDSVRPAAGVPSGSQPLSADSLERNPVSGANGVVRMAEARYVEYYARLILESEQDLCGGATQATWLSYLSLEHANLSSSLNHSLISREQSPILAIGAAMYRYWLHTGRLQEGCSSLASIISAAEPGSDDESLGKCHMAYGVLMWRGGNTTAALQSLDRAIDLARGKSFANIEQACYHNAGCILLETGNVVAAREYLSSSLRLKRELGLIVGLPNTLNSLAVCAYLQGDASTALGCLDESEDIVSETHLTLPMARIHQLRALIFADQGQCALAEVHLSACRTILSGFGDQMRMADLLKSGAHIAYRCGDSAVASLRISQARDCIDDSTSSQYDVELELQTAAINVTGERVLDAIGSLKRLAVVNRRKNTLLAHLSMYHLGCGLAISGRFGISSRYLIRSLRYFTSQRMLPAMLDVMDVLSWSARNAEDLDSSAILVPMSSRLREEYNLPSSPQLDRLLAMRIECETTSLNNPRSMERVVDRALETLQSFGYN